MRGCFDPVESHHRLRTHPVRRAKSELANTSRRCLGEPPIGARIRVTILRGDKNGLGAVPWRQRLTNREDHSGAFLPTGQLELVAVKELRCSRRPAEWGCPCRYEKAVPGKNSARDGDELTTSSERAGQRGLQPKPRQGAGAIWCSRWDAVASNWDLTFQRDAEGQRRGRRNIFCVHAVTRTFAPASGPTVADISGAESSLAFPVN